ncbi:MAG TPA: hypothetical protein ENI94_03805, partial [Gammaproteobacteria bacterium]|nr:hypothetical protein [Gammaproteobacteria bacterium]
MNITCLDATTNGFWFCLVSKKSTSWYRIIPVVLLALVLAACGDETDPDDEDGDAGLTQISVSAASANEGDSGTSELVFNVTLDTPASEEVRVDYATADDSAQAGSDYQPVSDTLVIPANASTATVTVTLLGDTVVESDETFRLQLSNPVNAGLAAAEASGTIINDDRAPATRISVSSASANEGDSGTSELVFNVTLDTPASEEVRVDYATADDSAQAGS